MGALVLLAGCLIIPVDYHAPGSRHNVSDAATNLLHVGVTTREEVLLALGEPDYVSEDGQQFGHIWSKVKVLVVAGYSGGEFRSVRMLETTFDESNRVARVRVVGGVIMR
jgi:outer membrane protein assembly factor BamE (lipoprotein component of BamABCDE complex)